ncbi:MAG: flagellar basal body P-ring formation protein FlgA [Gammaproteobacteria bacterium]|nr:flagellar basal body P-ring formation protein FlgA [Gammaproteobacteria bacterium]
MNDLRQKTVAAMVLAASFGPAAGEEFAVEPHEDIRAAAEQHVLARTESLSGRIEVTVGNLDSRLRLAACDKALETYDSPNALSGGRGVVGVRCTGSKPWKLFVPVQVATLNQVVVSQRPLVRGQSLVAADLALKEIDTSTVHKAYFTRIEDVVGLRTKRAVSGGATLHAGLLQRAKLVKRGSQVMIVSALDGLHVTMRGKALADGGRGDRIRAKNLASGRVITGTVTDSGVIEVTN